MHQLAGIWHALNAIRGAYLADRKPFLFESGVWLPGDYETTYVIATIADYQRPNPGAAITIRRRNDKQYRAFDPVAGSRTRHPHRYGRVRGRSGRLDGGSWCCLGEAEPMRRRAGVSSTASAAG
jgi:hypothetical protein